MFLMYTKIVEMYMTRVLPVMYTLFLISSALRKTVMLTCQIIVREYITDIGLYCDNVFRLVNIHFYNNIDNQLDATITVY